MELEGLSITDRITFNTRGGTFKIVSGKQCGFFKFRVSHFATETVNLIPSKGFIDSYSEVDIRIVCNSSIEKQVNLQVNFLPCSGFINLSEHFNSAKKTDLKIKVRSLDFTVEEEMDLEKPVVNYEENLLHLKLHTIKTELDTYVVPYSATMSERNVKLLSNIAGQLGVSQAVIFREEASQVELPEKIDNPDRNSVVVCFLSKLCNYPQKELSEAKLTKLDAVYVLLQQISQARVIPRQASQHNLQLLALSGSKKLIENVQKRHGGGSYWHLRDHYGANSASGSNKDVLRRPQDGNGVIIAIGDNIQPKVTASSAYVANQKMPLDVCYNLMFARVTFFQKNLGPQQPDETLANKFQKLLRQPTNQPGNWSVFGSPSSEQLKTLEKFEDNFKPFAITVLREIVSKRIDKLRNNKDPVEAAADVKNTDTLKVCCFCAGVIRLDVDKCKHCQKDVKNLPVGQTLYEDIPSPNIGRRVESIPGPIADINPNGFDKCRKVLIHVEKKCLVDDIKLHVLHQDSVPYKYMAQNRQHVKFCEDHQISFFDFPWDSDGIHKECFTRYRFDKIILENSLGHQEFGIESELTELVWEPYLKDIASKFGINSPGAVRSLHKSSNHHKQIKALWSLFYGLLDELCFMYLKKKDFPLSVSSSVVADDFLKNFKTIFVNENLIAAFDITMLGIFRIILRKAIRRGETDVTLGALCALKCLPYSQHHPTAIETRMRWITDLAQCRESKPEVFMMIKLLMVISKSGDSSYQPPDLHQEEIIPWLNNMLFGQRGNCGSYEAASKNLRLFGDLITPERSEDQNRKVEHLEQQILTVRCTLRESQIFSRPEESSPLVSVSGQPLSRNFHNIVPDMVEKCKRYREALVKTDYSQIELEPKTPITHDDEQLQNSLEYQPRIVIFDHVLSEIDKLPEGSLKVSLLERIQSKPKIRVTNFENEFNLTGNSIPRIDTEHGCLRLCDLKRCLETLNTDILSSEKFTNFVKIKVKCWSKSDLMEILELLDSDENTNE